MRRVLCLFPILAVQVLAGCAGDEGAVQGRDARVAEAGEAVAASLTRELMGRVTAAIQEGGAAFAIEFCSEQALPVTASVAESLGVDVKRTSARVRNPANAPDAHEQAALEYFAAEVAAGNSLPAQYQQRTEAHHRYYKPIVVADFCTACHGPRESLDPAVLAVLDARYPDDRATGYRAGDFRGVIRVGVPIGDGDR